MSTVVEKYLSQILSPDPASRIFAYRGQKRSNWLLQSGATRRLVQEHGEGIIEDHEFPNIYHEYHRDTLVDPARTRGYGFDSGRQLTDLELLAKLQHFGAWTGLLDLTWSVLVALWFASDDPNHDGKLFKINVNDPLLISKISDDETGQSLPGLFLPLSGSQLVSYWEPPSTGDALLRIVPQRSVFIVGRPLVNIGPSGIDEFVIEKGDKVQLAKELNALDFDDNALFLDVYGFAQASKRRQIPDISPAAHVRNGNRSYQQGDFDRAVEHYSRAIDRGSVVGMVHLLRGNAFAALGKHAEAVADYSVASADAGVMQRGYQDAAFYNRGNSKAQLGDFEGAVGDFTAAVDLNPEVPQYYYNRGNSYMDLYRMSDALADYRAAIEQGFSANAIANKVVAMLAMGQLHDAYDCCVEAVQNPADSSLFQQNLWTLEQILLIADQLEYTVKAAPSPENGTMRLHFVVPEAVLDNAKVLERFVFKGRAGNTGNTGGPGQVGGSGFTGSEPIFIVVEPTAEG